MPYVPHTPDETREMLRTIGAERLDDLFRSIPEEIRLRRPLRIPARKSEAEIVAAFRELETLNSRTHDKPSFLGGGSYRRFVPAAVDYLSGRGEFSTAYTPYQPEVSQGTLQAIFEYQSLIARLTGMEISNASMYEAGTALVEAVFMAYAIHPKGTRVLVSEGVHPEYLRVLDTYLRHHPLRVERLPLRDGLTDPAALRAALDGAPGDVAAVAFQSPNYLGAIEDGAAISALVKGPGGPAASSGSGGPAPLVAAVVDPISLAILKPPGEYGADVAVGDGQQLGNYPAYGGPTFGFFATRHAHVRKIPGRIVGETKDRDGKRGYVLTFQTREQHIRRERATSNICTNQGLCSLRAAMYLALLGEEGLREVAETSTRKAHAARARLLAVPGVRPATDAPFFCEFPLELPIPAEDAYDRLGERGIVGGLPLSRLAKGHDREMLFAVTELTPMADVERLAAALGDILHCPPPVRARPGDDGGRPSASAAGASTPPAPASSASGNRP